MKELLNLYVFILSITAIADAQVRYGTDVQKISVRKGEKWFGGAVNEGHIMPFPEGYSYDLYGDNKGNQSAPLLLSTKGRYVPKLMSARYGVTCLRLSRLGKDSIRGRCVIVQRPP